MARRRTPPPPPPVTTVFLVRHGKTPTTGSTLPGRAPGLHLSDDGKAQAEAVAARLADAPGIQAIYTSPLERTRETARPIAKTLGLKATPARGLLECDFGEWTGQALKDLAALPEWQTVQRYPSGFRFPGGESFSEMHQRITDTLAHLAERHRGGAFVAVSHADPIKAAVADALGTHLDLFQRIAISPCSVTVIVYGPAGPMVLGVNTTSGSLGALQPS